MPDRIRLETRLILDSETDDRLPYVIEVRVNGEGREWHKVDARPSGSARYSGLVIGQRKRFTVGIPKRKSRVAVRLIAAEGRSCLVRFRQIEEDEE